MRLLPLLVLGFSVTTSSAAAQAPLLPAPVLAGPGSALSPKTVVPALVACTDVPVDTVPASPLRIVAPHSGDEHELSYRDDLVVLNAGTPNGLLAGQRYFVRRYSLPRGARVTGATGGDPVAAVASGFVRTAGWLTVVAADTRSALARIDYACDAIAAGDYLDAWVEPTLPAAPAPGGASDFSDLGRVLRGVDQHESFGAGDVLTIDRGTARGLQAGVRVAFYRDRENGTPLFEIGSGVVLEVAADSAKVLVDRARIEVTAGDYYALRRP